jgi:hypothetical protein
MPENEPEELLKRIAELEKELAFTRARLESAENEAAKSRRIIRELKSLLEKKE